MPNRNNIITHLKQLSSRFASLWLVVYCLINPDKNLIAQTSEADSLFKLLKIQKGDTLRANTLTDLSYALEFSNMDSAMYYAREALSLSEVIDYDKGRAQAQKRVGQLFYFLGTYDSAQHFLGQSVATAKKINLERTLQRALSLIGQCHWRSGDLDSAYYYFQTASNQTTDSMFIASNMVSLAQLEYSRGNLSLALQQYEKVVGIQKKVDSSNVARTLYNIASVYDDQGNKPKAFAILEEAAKWAQLVDDRRVYKGILTFKGQILKFQKDYDKALALYEEALEMSKSLGSMGVAYQYLDIGDVHGAMKNDSLSHQYYLKAAASAKNTQTMAIKAAVFYTVGFSYKRLQQYDSAIYYAKLGLAVGRDANAPYYIGACAGLLGEIYIQLNNTVAAEKYLLESFDIAETSGFYSLKESSSESLAALYKTQGRPWEALKYFEIFHSAADSAFNEDKVKEITRLEAQYNFDQEKQTLTAEQERQELLHQQELKRQKIIQYVAFGGVGVFLLISALIFRFYQVKKRDNALLTEQNQQITQQKEEILAQKEELAQQSEELKASNDKLYELSKFKDGFTHMIAHDMKNPLNTIITHTHGVMQEEQIQINLAGQQLLRLITNMLEVQKFEEAAPVLHLETTDVNTLIQTAISEASLLAESKSIAFKIKADRNCLLQVDGDMIIRALVNLLSNAIKYSPSHCDIRMEVQVTDDNTIISVTDQGGGIPEAYLPHLFNRFWQAAPTASGIAKSTGLGLAYCKLVVEAHQGRIDVISAEGKGTTFFIHLPVVTTTSPSPNWEDDMGILTATPASTLKKIPLVKPEETATIASFAQRFKVLRVYQVSQLMTVLNEMEAHHLKSKWENELKNAIHYGNDEKYKELVDMVL